MGYVLPGAIDKGICMAIQESKSPECTAIALDMAETHSFQLEDLKPLDAGRWRNYVMGVVHEMEQRGHKINNFNLVFRGNIPAGAGLSSSAALANAIVFALQTIFKLGLSKIEMIQISQAAENNFAGVKCGIMDQFASMFGKKDCVLFLDCKTLLAEPVPLELQGYQIVLLNTQIRHNLSNSAYNDRRVSCEGVAKMFGVPSLRELSLEDLIKNKSKILEEDFQKALFVLEENNRVIAAVSALRNNDLKTLGILLYESHKGLQNLFKVSCAELDCLVDMARESEDVVGARMMGGGFGGCTLNLVKKNKITSFTRKANEKYMQRFNHSITSYLPALDDGTRLIP